LDAFTVGDATMSGVRVTFIDGPLDVEEDGEAAAALGAAEVGVGGAAELGVGATGAAWVAV
jgi:hypothetical protein